MTWVLIWFAVTSQVGLVALGWLANIYFDSTLKQLVADVRELLETAWESRTTITAVRPSDD